MTLGKYIIHSQCLASYVPVSHRDQKNCRLADKFIVKQTCKEQSKNFVNFAPAILEKTSLFIVVVYQGMQRLRSTIYRKPIASLENLRKKFSKIELDPLLNGFCLFLSRNIDEIDEIQ